MGEWEALEQRCLQCQACALAQTRTHVVFGMGTPQAEVLFVGEAPGATEALRGKGRTAAGRYAGHDRSAPQPHLYHQQH